jgi:hemerythrin
MVDKVHWTPELEIGINVIDNQHQRIVEYINLLADMDAETPPAQVAELINALIDYTYSHFAFEEALMEEAGYQYLTVHRRTHEAFTDRVQALFQRFKAGDQVSEEIGQLLQTWLINHIMEDDRSYAPIVKQQLSLIESRDSGGWLSRTLHRFFH